MVLCQERVKGESREVTLRDVEKEMAKPRVVESVRRVTAVDRDGGSPRK